MPLVTTNDTITYSPALPWLPLSVDAEYGRCLAGVYDLAGGMSSGRQALAEALARMLITDAGTLCPVSPDDTISPVYGYNLLDFLNGRMKPRDLSEMAANIVTQWRLDDRVFDASVRLTYAGGVLVIFGTVVDKAGPFPLTLSVNDVTIAILNTQNTP
jgi:hypothetical protein